MTVAKHSRKSETGMDQDVIAIDLGASSGRVSRVGFNGESFQVEEVHRFPNVPININGTIFGDIQFIWNGIESGIRKSQKGAKSVGVDRGDLILPSLIEWVGCYRTQCTIAIPELKK